MPETIIVLDASGSGADPVVREMTPEEQAEKDALAAIPRITYAESRNVDERVRTTDDVPLEVFRFPTQPKHVYRATLGMTAIDATSGATKDAEVRMVFKRLASTLAQVGATAVLSTMQDAAASSWGIQPSVDETELVIAVRGAAGRTVDWLLAGSVAAYAPEGVPS